MTHPPHREDELATTLKHRVSTLSNHLAFTIINLELARELSCDGSKAADAIDRLIGYLKKNEPSICGRRE